ncbi:hypothetical protein [Agromyces sp. Marseille-P2726]|uniref:hypothetical protein n=1 Tax=Agromyces sp. Marseille-P2726 TaxID=2709132 RepID=UPI00156D4B58|nr:hypothetical protein [Agromyces sp. Marseille-P2726]
MFGTIVGLASILGVVWQISGIGQGSASSGGPGGGTAEPPPSASATPTGSSVAALAADIHVGFPAARIDELFGGPIATRVLDGKLGWVEHTYARDSVAATAVVDDSGITVLYSVLVCEPDVAAPFQTPSGSTVVLQEPPIGQSESWDSEEDPNERSLYYLEGGTGSSLGQLIEESVVPQASGHGWKTHLVGINRACGDTLFLTPETPTAFEYFGTLEDAPADLVAFRERTPANFYTEIADDYRITEYGVIDFFGAGGEALGALASAYVHDLPPGFAEDSNG